MLNRYHMNFLLVYDHPFTMTEIDDMLPWEREILIAQVERKMADKAKAQGQG